MVLDIASPSGLLLVNGLLMSEREKAKDLLLHADVVAVSISCPIGLKLIVRACIGYEYFCQKKYNSQLSNVHFSLKIPRQDLFPFDN